MKNQCILRPADQMMTNFHRELNKIKNKNATVNRNSIKKNTIKKSIDAYSSTLVGSKHDESICFITMRDGIFLICEGLGSNGKEVAKFIGN